MEEWGNAALLGLICIVGRGGLAFNVISVLLLYGEGFLGR